MPGTANSGGRNRKSEAQHKLQGTYQKVRHAGVKTPEAPAGVPEPPQPLDGLAAEEWARMIGRLQLVGSLSVVDDAAVYQYCRLWAETESAMADLETARGSAAILEENIRGLEGADLVAVFQELGKLRHDIKGYVTTLRQGRMALRQYLVEFGMTPSARSRVKLPEKPEADPFAEFEDGATH